MQHHMSNGALCANVKQHTHTHTHAHTHTQHNKQHLAPHSRHTACAHVGNMQVQACDKTTPADAQQHKANVITMYLADCQVAAAAAAHRLLTPGHCHDPIDC